MRVSSLIKYTNINLRIKAANMIYISAVLVLLFLSFAVSSNNNFRRKNVSHVFSRVITHGSSLLNFQASHERRTDFVQVRKKFIRKFKRFDNTRLVSFHYNREKYLGFNSIKIPQIKARLFQRPNLISTKVYPTVVVHRKNANNPPAFARRRKIRATKLRAKSRFELS